MVQYPTSMKSVFAWTNLWATKETYSNVWPIWNLDTTWLKTPILDVIFWWSNFQITQDTPRANGNFIANVVAQIVEDSQESNDDMYHNWIEITVWSWKQEVTASVWDWVELIVSWSVWLDVSWIEWEVLDPEKPVEPEFAIVTHHKHPWKVGRVPIEFLHEILRKDREATNTIDWDYKEVSDDQ